MADVKHEKRKNNPIAKTNDIFLILFQLTIPVDALLFRNSFLSHSQNDLPSGLHWAGAGKIGEVFRHYFKNITIILDLLFESLSEHPQ